MARAAKRGAPRLADLMTREVITAKPDEPLSKGVNRMMRNRIGSLVLADREDLLWGVLTESDVMRTLHQNMGNEDMAWIWQMPMREISRRRIISIREDESCAAAVHKMAANRIRRLVVMDRSDEEMVGIVTERDLLQAMARIC